MERVQDQFLDTWLLGGARRPLVVRGARQVGKTYLVRRLAERHGLHLVEINFERNPERAKYFEARDPRRILQELSLIVGREIVPAASLLFLDEIQAVPELLAGLRWFAEELPEIAVVAAGSLLDFALARHSGSVPVGRIAYCYVEPMTFPEYLRAHGQQRLVARLGEWRPGLPASGAAFDEGSRWFERYTMVGGMPAVVAADVRGEAPRECRRMQRDIVATYRDDFAKYTGRMDPRILDAVLRAVAGSLGRKLVYARVDEGVKQQQAKHAIELLASARLISVVAHTAANGVPLGGETSSRSRKVILLDVGLLHALLGTPAQEAFPRWRDLAPGVRGQIVEQVAGQQLRGSGADPSHDAGLFYWHREAGRAGEVDYLAQISTRILPIEIKAGAAGAMKSMHQFMHDKRLDLAVRIDTNEPSLQIVDVKTTQGDAVRYRLLNLPHHMLWNLPALVDATSASLEGSR